MNRKSNCCFMCKDKRFFSHFVVLPYKNRAIPPPLTFPLYFIITTLTFQQQGLDQW